MIPDMDLIVKSTRKTNELKTVTFEALLYQLLNSNAFEIVVYYEAKNAIK